MWSKARMGLFILYSTISFLIACAVYISFQSQNENEHPVMNILAYFIAPIFVSICTAAAFALLFVLNKIEKKTSTYRFGLLAKLVGIFVLVNVIVYSFSSCW